MAGKPIKWKDKEPIKWNNNPYTWNEVLLAKRAAGEDWNLWEQKEKDKLVKLILKVHGNTITESKKKEIKQYKIKVEDIKITVKKVLGVNIMTENVKF